MGNNKYYPVYLSIGNIHNNVRHAHRDGIAIVAFLTLPKSEFLWDILVFNICLTRLYSYETTLEESSFPKFPKTALPYVIVTHLTVVETRNDNTWCRSLLWWTLQASCIWYRPEYCRLPRASASLSHRAGLVPQVCFRFSLFPSCLCLTRCTAKHDDLDAFSVHTLLCNCEHTESLVETLELGDLWEDYGLVGDIVVHFFPYIFLSRILVPLDYTISLFRLGWYEYRVWLWIIQTLSVSLNADPWTSAITLR